MGKISFGSGVSKEVAEKAMKMFNGAPKGGRLVRKESDESRQAKAASDAKKRREQQKHDALMRKSKEIKAKLRGDLSEEEWNKLVEEEKKKLAEDMERLEQERKEILARSKAKPSTSQARSPEEDRVQRRYDDWLRRRKEALEQIEYGKALDYADWANGRDYAPEYISEGERQVEIANWYLASLFQILTNGKDKNFIDSNKPFPGWEEYVIKNFGNLKDRLFKPKGEKASPESVSPYSGKDSPKKEGVKDSLKNDSPKKEGGEKKKMQTVRKHSLSGDSEDGKKE